MGFLRRYRGLQLFGTTLAGVFGMKTIPYSPGGANVDNKLEQMRKSFQPRQWFVSDGEPDPFTINDEDAFMWVYIPQEDETFEVGFFSPDGQWFADGKYDSKEDAARRVNYLNGGK